MTLQDVAFVLFEAYNIPLNTRIPTTDGDWVIHFCPDKNDQSLPGFEPATLKI